MSERIDGLVYKTDAPGTTLFLDGPAEFLAASVVRELKNIPQWVALFRDFIDPYQRADYSMRNLPALRIYNENFTKEYESWFIEGDIKADIIFPASIRRAELEQIPDSVSAALLQQFRRPTFFETVGSAVPGLNELGKRFSVDKTLGFMGPNWEEHAPLTQITLNFRIDLRQWDEYLEKSSRTKDDPFEESLANLKRIVGVIDGLRDEGATEVEIGLDQKI